MRTAAVVFVLIGAAAVLGQDPAPPPAPPPAAPPAASTVTPPAEVSAADIEAAIDRGVDFLVADQNPDGSWGTAERTKDLNIYAPVPGAHQAFKAAVTALCVAALCELDSPRSDAQAALASGKAWLLENLPRVRRATPDALYNVWTHAYGIQALVRMHRDCEADDAACREPIRDLIAQQIDLLNRYESVDGGWGYYDFSVGSQKPASMTTSFTTASALVALHEARALGIAVPDRLVTRAIDSIHRQRKSDGSVLYGYYLRHRPMRLINRPAGSLGRSQACNAALRMWGDPLITNAVIEEWLQRLQDRRGWLDIGRKRPIPHEAWFQVAGYFFYYAHYYAALCIEQLEPAQRPAHQKHLARALIDLQETDGSWFDYPLYNYHQQYGTAFALMSLLRCRPR